MKFVDEVFIDVSSGQGGPGCVSFRREKFAPRGGPDGGDGGRGGHVIFKTSSRVHSLLDLKIKRKYFANNGGSGSGQLRTGADGQDLIITVPVGTVLKSSEGDLLRDLDHEGEFEFLKGGQGGRGNHFYKSSVNQAPSVAQRGLPGQKKSLKLELKLLADVGIIGFPNAGKSTFISHISAAKPKVADYPFTTLTPQLGVVRHGEESHYVVADMPGLIKDAHRGIGLGTRFLKHIERTKCFVHLIDASGMSGREPLKDYKDLRQELVAYDSLNTDTFGYKKLQTRREIVALNKVDVLNEEQRSEIEKQFCDEGIDVLFISAATGVGLKDLTNQMGHLVFQDKNEDTVFS